MIAGLLSDTARGADAPICACFTVSPSIICAARSVRPAGAFMPARRALPHLAPARVGLNAVMARWDSLRQFGRPSDGRIPTWPRPSSGGQRRLVDALVLWRTGSPGSGVRVASR